MEIKGTDGSKFQLKDEGEEIEFGRGQGFDSTDPTVSRRHVSFRLFVPDHGDEAKVQFKVTGKNPIWVQHNNKSSCSDKLIRVYKRFESGEMGIGDMFCISANNPIWFTLQKTSNGMDLDESIHLQGHYDFGLMEDLQIDPTMIDTSTFDPVKDFGFVVMGHEFDCYPKKMIRDIKNWDWFIDEAGGDSESDDGGGRRGKSGGRRKRKKGGGGENDDEWTGESEEDMELITKVRKVQRPKYLTRSKNIGRTKKNGVKSGKRISKNNTEVEEEEEEEEDDETLGGFIVDEEDVGEETESEEDEEEEFDEEADDE